MAVGFDFWKWTQSSWLKHNPWMINALTGRENAWARRNQPLLFKCNQCRVWVLIFKEHGPTVTFPLKCRISGNHRKGLVPFSLLRHSWLPREKPHDTRPSALKSYEILVSYRRCLSSTSTVSCLYLFMRNENFVIFGWTTSAIPLHPSSLSFANVWNKAPHWNQLGSTCLSRLPIYH